MNDVNRKTIVDCDIELNGLHGLHHMNATEEELIALLKTNLDSEPPQEPVNQDKSK